MNPPQDVAAVARPTQAGPTVDYVTDSKGRRIGYRAMNALEKLRFFKAVGAIVGSNNQGYLGMAVLAASVREIDGNPEPFPGSEREVEAMVATLGDEGLAALAEAVAEQSEPDAGAEEDLAKK